MAVENNFVESLPEEIIQTILAFCISFPSLPYTFPPCDALGNPLPGITSKTGHSRAAPLLVSKYWLRVATPLLYRSISLVDKEQARLLARTLLGNVTIASCVRSVRAAGFWNFLRCLTRVCHETEYLEIELDADGGLSSQGDLQELAATIGDLSQLDIKHFVLRKPSRAYTTCPWIITATAHLADVLPLWPNLRTVHIAFPLPCTATAATHSLATHSLVSALSRCPSLHVFRTQLPATWSPALLIISRNPNLQKIELRTTLQNSDEPIPGSGLFLREAKKHAKLDNLIRAGTQIVRQRAHTFDSSSKTTRISSDLDVPSQLPSSFSVSHHLNQIS